MFAGRALFLCTLGNISGRNPSCHSCAVVLKELKVCLQKFPKKNCDVISCHMIKVLFSYRHIESDN